MRNVMHTLDRMATLDHGGTPADQSYLSVPLALSVVVPIHNEEENIAPL